MEIKNHLLSLCISILLLPCYVILLFVIKPIFQLSTPLFRLLISAHFTWLPDSQFVDRRPPLDQSKKAPPCGKTLGVSKYRVGVEKAKCVFCLCVVEEGEEVRELRCRHVFHRLCLDRWLEFGNDTCPLCRAPLVPFKARARFVEMNDWWVW